MRRRSSRSRSRRGRGRGSRRISEVGCLLACRGIGSCCFGVVLSWWVWFVCLSMGLCVCCVVVYFLPLFGGCLVLFRRLPPHTNRSFSFPFSFFISWVWICLRRATGCENCLLISSCVDRSSAEVDEGYVGYFDMRDLGLRNGFIFSDIGRLQSIVMLAHDAGRAWGCLGWNTMSGCGMATMSDDLMMSFLGLFINRYTM